MNEDLEHRLHEHLHAELPPAPAATRAFLERLPLDQPKVGRRIGAGRAAVMAVVGIGLVALASVAGLGGSPEPSDGLVASPTTVVPSPTGSPPPSSPADTLNGLTIHTVSELLDLRSSGRIGGEPVALRGFWSDSRSWHSCVLTDSPPGELQNWCWDREFGITERDEPILTVRAAPDGRHFDPTDGPALTPFVDDALEERLDLPHINGQHYRPVPIVVVGHFDDPRAADCWPEVRHMCRDRLVLDEILEFRPEAVPTPGVTPSPTPFPFADPPPAPFTKADCFGDIPYSFIGWGPMSDYGIDVVDRVVFIMVPRDEVRFDGSVARWLCWGYEGKQGLVKSKTRRP